MLTINLLLFFISCVILIISGFWLVKSLEKIGSFLKISEFVLGFILMAFATSLPELFVGVTSALAHNSALALGNIIGSNIADLTFVIGITIILAKGIPIKSKKIRKDAIHMFFIAALPVILMIVGQTLSRLDGAILVGVGFLYGRKMIIERKTYKKPFKDKVKKEEVILNSFLFIISVVLLFLSAHFIVKYATSLSIELKLSSLLIGLFIIAIGTTLPELVFGSSAVLSGHSGLALGNLIGSIVVNSTLILGVTALIWPITISASFLIFLISAIFMLIIAFLFVGFVGSGKLNWTIGVSLVLFYVVFVIIEFYIRSLVG